jgi:hypothetical protein
MWHIVVIETRNGVTTMRTKITVDSNGDVTVTGENPVGEMETTIYFVPTKGGYVRERDYAGRFPQVCERLSTRGNTLWSTRDALPGLIRRELQRAKAYEARHWAA